MKRLDKRRLAKRALRSATSKKAAPREPRDPGRRVPPHRSGGGEIRLQRIAPFDMRWADEDFNRSFLRDDPFDLLSPMVIRPEHHPGGGRRR